MGTKHITCCFIFSTTYANKDFRFCIKKVGNCTRGQLSVGLLFWGKIVQLAIAHRELPGGAIVQGTNVLEPSESTLFSTGPYYRNHLESENETKNSMKLRSLKLTHRKN